MVGLLQFFAGLQNTDFSKKGSTLDFVSGLGGGSQQTVRGGAEQFTSKGSKDNIAQSIQASDNFKTGSANFQLASDLFPSVVQPIVEDPKETEAIKQQLEAATKQSVPTIDISAVNQQISQLFNAPIFSNPKIKRSVNR